jgi:hypothetical protein
MGAVDGCGCTSVGAGWLLAAKGWIVRPWESIADRNRAGSRLLFLAELLESRIAT